MASLSRDSKTGTRRIQFKGLDGKRKTIYLPGETLANARTIKARIESLLKAAHSKYEWGEELAKWVSEISDEMAEKLVKAGLIPPRTRQGSDQESEPVNPLGQFLKSYISSRVVKPNTLRNFNVTKGHLVNHFGANRELGSITPGDADEWREGLRRKGLEPPTVNREAKRAKQFFRAATRRRLITEDPFEDVKGGKQENRSRLYFLSREDALKVLDACPTSEWRSIFALARYGGLRCPSEVGTLRWDNVLWDQGRILVHSPKTEHIDGKESRVIPLFSELRPYLEEAFDQAEAGAVLVAPRASDPDVNLRTELTRIICRAGLKPWPKLFQNLRSTRETELAGQYPIHVVCKWIGNSELVAAKHYLQVTDEDFESALKPTTHETTHSQQILQSQASPRKAETPVFSAKDEGWRPLASAKYPHGESNPGFRTENPTS
jgi:integrase